LLALLIIYAQVGHADNYLVNGEVLDDERAAELITVIVTTSLIPSVPSLKHLYPAFTSLFKVPAFAKCKKIIVFDGLPPKYVNRAEDYKKYKKRVKTLTKLDPQFSSTKLVFCDKWVHLSGALREAMQHVTTPFVFIHQHDMSLIKEFDLNGCLASMLLNPNIKQIHFPVVDDPRDFGEMFSTWYGPIDDYIEGVSVVPLIRYFGWSDYAHVTTTKYLKEFVLPKCGHGPMEAWLHPAFKQAVIGADDDRIDEVHLEFGTFLYGDMYENEGNYFHHSDGANR
jgi:hypothetical protein